MQTPTRSRVRNRVARRLADTLEQGRTCGSEMLVECRAEVWGDSSTPGHSRPDVVVYRCLADDRRLYARDVLLAVEIVSPDSSFRTDTVDKKAAYAAAGIPVYLIVFMAEAQGGIEQIEEYRLSEGRYHLVCLHTRRLQMDMPIGLDVAFDTLAAG